MALERHVGPAFLASLATHVIMVALVVLAMSRTRIPARRAEVPSDRAGVRMVFLNEPGSDGGGGGGGNRMVQPARRAELRGRDAISVPAAKPPTLSPSSTRPPDSEPMPRLIVPVVTLASGAQALPGEMNAPPAPPTSSQGPGDGGGAGRGTGTGDGPGRGPGLGSGYNGGIDGGPYLPGNGVTMPIEIRKGTPQYTTEAMRARAQGAITVECVVQPTGVCTNIRVKRSFDPAFGLDQEAIKAAAQWRFRPGTRRGEPVPVLVTMEIAFALR